MTSSFSTGCRRPRIGLDSLRLESAGRQSAMRRGKNGGVQMVRGDGWPEKERKTDYGGKKGNSTQINGKLKDLPPERSCCFTYLDKG